MAGKNKTYITLEADDKASVAFKKLEGNTGKAFDKIKTHAKAGAAQAGKFERAWKTSINHLKRHWKKYAVASVAAVYGVTKIISGAITKMKEYVGLANVQETAERKLEAVLKATGNAAGYNLDQLKKMASGMQSVTTVGDEVTLSGMAILATFKQIRGEGFERATKAAMDMSAVMGQDLKSSMVMIGKAVNDPITGMSMLTRVGVTFTQQQKDMARQLQESGDMAGAQNIILKELESQFGGTAAALRKDFGGSVIAAGNALGDTKEEMGFLITKNQFFIKIIHLAEKQFIAWGKKIEENRGYLQDLLKSGVMKLVGGVVLTIKTMRFFHNAWLGIKLVGTAAIWKITWELGILFKALRFLMTPLDMIFEGLKKMGVIKINPFDQVEKALGQFKASSANVTKNVLKDIKKTNKTYDLVIKKVEGWQKQIKAIPVEQVKTEKKITKSLKNIGKVQAATTKKYLTTEQIKNKNLLAYMDDLIKEHKAASKEKIKITKNEAKAVADYAKESTKIYDRMYDDIQKLDLGDYAYNLKLLAQRYTNYKDHLEALARQDSKYSGGVQLLDQWMVAEKQKLWDDWARKHGSVLDRLTVRWHDYQKEAISINSVAYDAISAGAANLHGQISDNLFLALTGDMDKMKFSWDSLWRSMVRSVTDAVAHIAVEAAVLTSMNWVMGLFAAKGVWEVKEDQVPAIVHKGEMIVPAEVAGKLRDSASDYSPTFAGLSAAVDRADPAVDQAFAKGSVEMYSKIGAIGGVATLNNLISPEQWAKGMLSPQAYATSVLFGGLPSAAAAQFGLDPKAAKTGFYTGALSATAIAGFGTGAGILAGLIGMIAGEAVADILDMRALENIKDYYEDTIGNIAGRKSFAKDAAFITPSSLGVEFNETMMGLLGLASAVPGSITGQSFDLGDMVSAAAAAQNMANITDVWGQTYDFSVPGDYGGGGSGSYGGSGPGSYSGSDDFGESNSYGGGGDESGDDGNADAEGGGQGQYRKGGLARRASIFGEHGPEWAVPTYEPERSQFLRDVGADPDKIAAAIAKKINAGSGGGNTFHFDSLFKNEGTLIADEDTFNEFVEKIDERLYKLQQWGH